MNTLVAKPAIFIRRSDDSISSLVSDLSKSGYKILIQSSTVLIYYSDQEAALYFVEEFDNWTYHYQILLAEVGSVARAIFTCKEVLKKYADICNADPNGLIKLRKTISIETFFSLIKVIGDILKCLTKS